MLGAIRSQEERLKVSKTLFDWGVDLWHRFIYGAAESAFFTQADPAERHKEHKERVQAFCLSNVWVQQQYRNRINFSTLSDLRLRMTHDSSFATAVLTEFVAKDTPQHQALLLDHSGQLHPIVNTNAITCSNENYSPLARVAFHGSLTQAVFLLRNGANPNILDSQGQIPLLWALAKIKKLPIETKLSMVELLLSSEETWVELPGESTLITPLQASFLHADSPGRSRIIVLLLERGANLTKVDRKLIDAFLKIKMQITTSLSKDDETILANILTDDGVMQRNEELLAQYVSVACRDLNKAREKGHIFILHELLKKGYLGHRPYKTLETIRAANEPDILAVAQASLARCSQ